jgi:SAM-dependent methyltransferase
VKNSKKSKSIFPINRVCHLLCIGGTSILNGNYKDIIYYIDTKVHKIDLSPVSLEELKLPLERANGSSSSGGASLEHVLDPLKITSHDAIVDLGCGKGGAIITLAKYPFRLIAGVEISSDLVKIAQNNFLKLKISDVVLHCCDAGKFVELDEFNYIYMNNPFPCDVVEEVMINVSNSLMRNPRDLTMIYRWPICRKEVMESSLFEEIDDFSIAKIPYCINRHYR